jgi:hypothetical protein
MCDLYVWLHGMDRDSSIMFTHYSDILEFWHFGRGGAAGHIISPFPHMDITVCDVNRGANAVL